MITSGSEIEIGVHPTFEWAGMTFNIDTMTSTVISAAIVLVLGFLLRSRVSAESPGKIQLAWELLVTWVNDQVESNLGKLNPFVVPLAVSLFAFILFANWLEVVPTMHKAPPPTADVNLTYALALLVIVSVHVYGARENGLRGYGKHFMEPMPALLPLNLMEEIIKPVSLALRLFGNIFAGGIMISLIGLLPNTVFWIPEFIWKLFGMAIGGLQAFIFALLTILYFGIAGQGHGGDSHGPEKSGSGEPAHDDTKKSASREPEGELQPA